MGKFKAIIVGGSIAGQALALAFDKGNIDYVLLEARSEMAPNLGASVGLFPSGLRILDQLGLLEKISATTVPMETGFYRQKHNGKVFCQSTMLQELTKRHGYNFTFFERQKLLSIMYDAQSDKSKLLINKTIISIDEDESGVKVTTKDGSVYEGDVVIGADGVWSTVREHMWKQMEKAEQPPAELQEDRTALFCDYTCLFGISNPTEGLKVGHIHIVYGSGSSFLLAVGKDGIVYWFHFRKLPQRYASPNIPRFTEQDAIDSAEKELDSVVAENVTFGDVWKNQKSAIQVPMEESVFKKWHYGRSVILGDSAHKFTANFGMGANQALASAIVLTNALHEQLQKKPNDLDASDINAAFSDFQSKRYEHVSSVFQAAYDTTRIEAMDGLKNILIGRYIMPLLGESVRLALVKSKMVPTPSLNFIDKPNTPHDVPYLDEEELKQPQTGFLSWLRF